MKRLFTNNRNTTEGIYTGQLPPGQYKYTQQLPMMMNDVSPSYNIPTEPVFLNHLLMHLNKKVRIVTIVATLEGVVSGVAIDHVQLTIDGVNYHVRFDNIVYFRKI